ncbi:iron complex outermembrane recepter protein [Saccharicrinis carchari]|uniref:Iron complex outermembrane recepter protein n=1 Tax=Saccharicrinis carchari TaxID=1168039 RepID=A0A521AWN9_SACCC|nr:TonB-dependent receptor [Saccharicrinis carchari]SMO39248.1 iron complex outermembrane recepter protein [Saccharicrinis carchari]
MKIMNYITNESVMLFKKWQGTNYAIFNSLNRYVRIGMLSAIYFTFLGYGQTFAQTDTASVSKKIKLEEVKVSARRVPALYSEIGRVVTVITKKDIDALPVQSIDQLLEYVAHVDVRQRGVLGVQSDVSVRGGSFDQVMILLNGINITDPQTGHHNLNLPVDFQSIERVEILEGPGARIFGSNAFSGAINFITGSNKDSQINANIMAGEHGLYKLGASGTIAHGKTKSFLAVNKSATDGYIANTDFEIYNLFYHGQLHTDSEHLELQLGYTDKGFGANSFYTARYPNQYEQTKTTFASLSFASKTKNPIKSSVYWRRHHDRFELFRGNQGAATWYTHHNYHLTDVLGANLNTVVSSAIGKTAMGADIRSESIWSNVLGFDMKDTLKTPGEKDGFFTKKHNRTNTSFFLEHSYTLNRLSVSAGLMSNLNSDLGWSFDIFPGFDISYWLNNNLKIYGSINKSLRMPTYTDLFYSSSTIIGNPDLKPEEATTYEGGIKFKNNGGISANISAFSRRGKNMIDWGKPSDAPDGTKWTTSNINDINTFGLEAVINANLQEMIKGQHFLQGINLSYSWLNQDKSLPSGYDSRYVFDYLKHKFSGSLQHALFWDMHASWAVQYQDRMGSYGEYDISSGTEITKDYEAFCTLDLKLTWQKPRYTLYAEATNLLDKKYTDIGQLYQPGRWVKMGVKIHLSL